MKCYICEEEVTHEQITTRHTVKIGEFGDLVHIACDEARTERARLKHE